MNNEKKKANAAKLSIISNTSLVILKLIVGIVTSSVSVISEAIHSGLDLIAAIIAYIAVKQSNNPPDEEHNFGHGKIENVSGAIEALLIFLAAALIIWEAFDKLYHPNAMPKVDLGIAVMGLSSIVNWFISCRLMKVAKETDSLALEADAWHLRTDVYTSLGVLVGLVLIRITNQPILDPIFAIGVALIIIKAAYDLSSQALEDLLDKKLPDSEEMILKEVIQERCPKVIDFHNFRSRKAGNRRFVEFHLVLPNQMTLQEAHYICDKIEEALIEKLDTVEVLIHTEPDENTAKPCEKPCGRPCQ